MSTIIFLLILGTLHWTLPGDPDRYRLLDDLGWRQHAS
jgi:hypothetical protein